MKCTILLDVVCEVRLQALGWCRRSTIFAEEARVPTVINIGLSQKLMKIYSDFTKMTLTDPGRVCSFGSGVKRSCLSPAMTTMCSGPPNLKAINTLIMWDSGSQQPLLRLIVSFSASSRANSAWFFLDCIAKNAKKTWFPLKKTWEF